MGSGMLQNGNDYQSVENLGGLLVCVDGEVKLDLSKLQSAIIFFAELSSTDESVTPELLLLVRMHNGEELNELDCMRLRVYVSRYQAEIDSLPFTMDDTVTEDAVITEAAGLKTVLRLAPKMHVYQEYLPVGVETDEHKK